MRILWGCAIVAVCSCASTPAPPGVSLRANSAWTDCEEVALPRPPCGERGAAWTTALRTFEDACSSGNACGCMKLGTMIGCKKDDRARATAYFQRACDLGVAMACSNLGVIVFWGQGVQPDKDRGLRLWRRGCDGGFSFGCFSLAEQYTSGEFIEKDLSVARKLMQRACDLGNVPACAKLKDYDAPLQSPATEGASARTGPDGA